MEKKVYESKKIYNKKYNKTQSTLQIDKSLYLELKEYLSDTNISIREYVANIIRESISKDLE